VPRLLFYVALFTVVVLWAMRYLKSRGGQVRPPRASGAPSARMPKELVCGACGTAYDPHKSSWICPKCGQ
jgi:rubrerythrin